MDGSPESAVTFTKWNWIQFGFLCCYTAGLHGSVSLPYYVAANSAIYLLAYYILLVLICVPICYIQIKLGAVYRRNIIGIFSQLVPILKGSAVAILLLTYIRSLTGSVELCFFMIFAFVSFASPYNDSTHPQHVDMNGLQYPRRFFSEDILQTTGRLGDGGTLVWYILLSLFLTWAIIFFLSFKGPSMLGKVSYVIVPVSILLLLVVLFYGQASDIQTVLIPDEFNAGFRIVEKVVRGNITYHIEENDLEDKSASLNTLFSPKTWMTVLLLHMQSVGLWSGVLPTLGTQIYNRKRTINIAWMILMLVYCVVPLLFVVALSPYYDSKSLIGEYPENMKPGIAFIFLGIFGKARHVPIVAFCLYVCVYLFGLLHQVMHLFAVWDALISSLPKRFLQIRRIKEIVIASVCFSSFLLCVPYSCQAGIYLYMLVYSNVDRLVFALMIITVVPFLIGYLKQEYMYIPLERACMSLWYGVASLISAGMLIYYFAVYVYPFDILKDDVWTEYLGWTIAIGPIVIGFILGAMHAVYSEEGSIKQRCIQALKTDSLRTTDSQDMSETGNTDLDKSPQNCPCESMAKTKIDTEVIIPSVNLFTSKIDDV